MAFEKIFLNEITVIEENTNMKKYFIRAIGFADLRFHLVFKKQVI